MGFRALRVINEDRVAPGRGFGTHSHADMEIVSFVLEGALAHKDSIGTGSIIRPNELQRMSAGTGISHSEFNASAEEPVHFLQIWILPERRGLQPGYQQKSFPASEFNGRLRLIGSRDGREGSVTIHQDVDLYFGGVGPVAPLKLDLREGRGAWVQVTEGAVDVNGTLLEAGDGCALVDEPEVSVTSDRRGDFLLFDLA